MRDSIQLIYPQSGDFLGLISHNGKGKVVKGNTKELRQTVLLALLRWLSGNISSSTEEIKKTGRYNFSPINWDYEDDIYEYSYYDSPHQIFDVITWVVGREDLEENDYKPYWYLRVYGELLEDVSVKLCEFGDDTSEVALNKAGNYREEMMISALKSVSAYLG